MYVQTSGAPLLSSGCAGLGCAGKCGKGGLGSIDLSTMTWEDYLLVGIVGAFIWNLAAPDSAAFTPSKKRSRRSKKSSGIGSTISAAAVVLLLAGGGYLAYQYFTGATAPGTAA